MMFTFLLLLLLMMMMMMIGSWADSGSTYGLKPIAASRIFSKYSAALPWQFPRQTFGLIVVALCYRTQKCHLHRRKPQQNRGMGWTYGILWAPKGCFHQAKIQVAWSSCHQAPWFQPCAMRLRWSACALLCALAEEFREAVEEVGPRETSWQASFFCRNPMTNLGWVIFFVPRIV